MTQPIQSFQNNEKNVATFYPSDEYNNVTTNSCLIKATLIYLKNLSVIRLCQKFYLKTCQKYDDKTSIVLFWTS